MGSFVREWHYSAFIDEGSNFSGEKQIVFGWRVLMVACPINCRLFLSTLNDAHSSSVRLYLSGRIEKRPLLARRRDSSVRKRASQSGKAVAAEATLQYLRWRDRHPAKSLDMAHSNA